MLRECNANEGIYAGNSKRDPQDTERFSKRLYETINLTSRAGSDNEIFKKGEVMDQEDVRVEFARDEGLLEERIEIFAERSAQ